MYKKIYNILKKKEFVEDKVICFKKNNLKNVNSLNKSQNNFLELEII